MKLLNNREGSSPESYRADAEVSEIPNCYFQKPERKPQIFADERRFNLRFICEICGLELSELRHKGAG